jgi:hypothetical protein
MFPEYNTASYTIKFKIFRNPKNREDKVYLTKSSLSNKIRVRFTQLHTNTKLTLLETIYDTDLYIVLPIYF